MNVTEKVRLKSQQVVMAELENLIRVLDEAARVTDFVDSSFRPCPPNGMTT